MPEAEIAVHAPLVEAIADWKRRRNAVVLAHTYQTPEIYHGIADVTGDSLALAHAAARSDAEVVVLCGVHFMAETAKLLAPDRTVLIPDAEAGCSLAASIRPQDVRSLRAAHPGLPVVTYVNTTAAVKAESDVCCTSANAVQVVESLGVPRVIMIPDEYLARWVATQTPVEIVPWTGHCEVHERFTASDLRSMRRDVPGLVILAHPECAPDVLREADTVGSTSGMIEWLRRERPRRAMLVTECSMSDNVAVELPDVEFVRPCALCPHMKRITLANVLSALERLAPRVEIDPAVATRARAAVERMLRVPRSRTLPVSSSSAPASLA